MRKIPRCSKWFVALSTLACLPVIPQPLTIEPPHTKVCWVVQVPERWRFTAEQRKEYETDHVSHLEFRRNQAGDGEILVAAWVFSSPSMPRLYSSNAYRISTIVGQRPSCKFPGLG